MLGVNTGKRENCTKSARRNIEITSLKVHFRIHNLTPFIVILSL